MGKITATCTCILFTSSHKVNWRNRWERRFEPVWGMVSLYVDTLPQTAILPKFFICEKAAVENGPPTCNQEGVSINEKVIRKGSSKYVKDAFCTHVFKEAVVSIWRTFLQCILEGADCFVVEGLIESQFFEESHLCIGPCWTHHLTTLNLGNLAHHRTYCPCCCIHQQGLTRLESQDLLYSIQSCQPGDNKEKNACFAFLTLII